MFTQAIYPEVEPLCFSRVDLCLSSILAVLLSCNHLTVLLSCNHLKGLPHVRSKALSEFTNYLQTYVVSFVFIASIYCTCGLRQCELCTSDHVLLRFASVLTALQPLTQHCRTLDSHNCQATIAKPLIFACRASPCPLLHTRIHRIVLTGKIG